MARLCCPECGSQLLYKDGLRYLSGGSTVQRWLCRNCGYRFSEKSISDMPKNTVLTVNTVERTDLTSSTVDEVERTDLTVPTVGTVEKYSQHKSFKNCLTQCNSDAHGKKVLVMEAAKATSEKREAGATETAQQHGLILEYAWKLKKRGLSDVSIKTRSYQLAQLVKHGADLRNPESVETVLATEKLTPCQKKNRVSAYTSYCKVMDIKWTPFKVKYQPKQPFIPLEAELDQLIAACGKTTAAFLQILKDTGARAGEIARLKWTDVNFEHNTISINEAEKGSNTRTLKVSQKAIAMIKNLPKKYGEYIFNPNPPLAASIKECLQLARKRLARNLQNPRFLQIHFHTFRHWKATMEYAKTKDILHVRQLLGHKQIQSTLVYTTLVNFEADEYVVKRPKTTEEEDELIKAGFEYVRFDDKMQAPIYRKRK
ncbi:MAG: tyrosine-type recombinase/integrase [Candidatus Bathyarchaeia archaeon]